jgi:hypothetical protein
MGDVAQIAVRKQSTATLDSVGAQCLLEQNLVTRRCDSDIQVPEKEPIGRGSSRDLRLDHHLDVALFCHVQSLACVDHLPQCNCGVCVPLTNLVEDGRINENRATGHRKLRLPRVALRPTYACSRGREGSTVSVRSRHWMALAYVGPAHLLPGR